MRVLDGDSMEIDGLVLSDGYVIVLEVKTTLRVDDVDEFVEEKVLGCMVRLRG